MADKKEEKRITKQLNKISLPQKILVLGNVDKSDHEKWDEKRNKNIGNVPAPTRFCCLGPAGVGKTNFIKNLLLNARPLYDNVYLVHPDVGYSNEYQDCDFTDSMTTVPDIQYFSEVIDPDNKQKNMCIIDDLECGGADKKQLRNLGLLFRYLSTHRNMSVIFSHQSFFCCPPIVRKMTNFYVIWRPRALNELALINNRVGLEKGLLKYIFDNIATGYRDNICIDLTENSPAKLRMNLFDVLDVEQVHNEKEVKEEEESEHKKGVLCKSGDCSICSNEMNYDEDSKEFEDFDDF